MESIHSLSSGRLVSSNCLNICVPNAVLRWPYTVTLKMAGYVINVKSSMCHWRGNDIPTKNTTVTTRISIFSLTLALSVSIINITRAKNPIQAQGGTGAEIFRVIMTIFGVDKTKGDVVAIVTVNDGEESRVKLFESYTFPSLYSNLSSLSPLATTATTANSGILEYVAIQISL